MQPIEKFSVFIGEPVQGGVKNDKTRADKVFSDNVSVLLSQGITINDILSIDFTTDWTLSISPF